MSFFLLFCVVSNERHPNVAGWTLCYLDCGSTCLADAI